MRAGSERAGEGGRSGGRTGLSFGNLLISNPRNDCSPPPRIQTRNLARVEPAAGADGNPDRCQRQRRLVKATHDGRGRAREPVRRAPSGQPQPAAGGQVSCAARVFTRSPHPLAKCAPAQTGDARASGPVLKY